MCDPELLVDTSDDDGDFQILFNLSAGDGQDKRLRDRETLTHGGGRRSELDGAVTLWQGVHLDCGVLRARRDQLAISRDLEAEEVLGQLALRVHLERGEPYL